MGALTVLAGFFFKLSAHEWIAVVWSIGFVLTTETINSAIENLADFVSPQWHIQIKRIKDIAAAAALLSAISALVVGLIIFLPKIYSCV